MSGFQADIVIVEDNPNDAELVGRVLRKHSLPDRLVFLKDGVEALEYLFAEGAFAHREVLDFPRVVLLDLKLPRVDGIDVLRRVKSDERTKNIPIVVMTSSTEERDLRMAYELGANSYVTKPIEFAEFADVVSKLGHYWLLMNKLPFSPTASVASQDTDSQ